MKVELTPSTNHLLTDCSKYVTPSLLYVSNHLMTEEVELLEEYSSGLT